MSSKSADFITNVDCILQDLMEIIERKNSDYSQHEDPYVTFKLSERLGISPVEGIILRLGDKWSRLASLSKSQEPNYESIEDTFIDIAGYSIIAISMIREANAVSKAKEDKEKDELTTE